MRCSSLLVLGLVLGCQGEPSQDSSAPETWGSLLIEATELDFGELTVGEQAEQTLLFSNVGDGALQVYDVAFADDTLRVHWELLGLTTVAIGPGGVHEQLVRFAPSSVGHLDANLRVASDDPQGPSTQVALRGEGLGSAELFVDPQALDFGTVTIGEAVELDVFLANFGDADLEVGEVSIIANTTDYSVVLDPAGTTLAPGAENGLVVVRFEPQYDGFLYGTLSIATNDPDAPVFEVHLSGEGDAPS